MSTSVRWPFRIFYRRKHQHQGVNRASQGLGSLNAGSQMANSNNFASGLNATNGNYGASNQFNAYYAGIDCMSGCNVEIDKWSAGIANNLQSGLNTGLGFIAHRHPPSLKTRFGLACRAFVNAWRGA